MYNHPPLCTLFCKRSMKIIFRKILKVPVLLNDKIKKQCGALCGAGQNYYDGKVCSNEK